MFAKIINNPTALVGAVRTLAHTFLPHSVLLRPKTEESFLQLINKRIASGSNVRIEITPALVLPKTVSKVIGPIGIRSHILVCHAMIDENERIQYERLVTKDFASSFGKLDVEHRRIVASICVLAADIYKDYLQGKAPGCEVIAQGNNGPLTQEHLNDLMSELTEQGVKVENIKKFVLDSVIIR